MDLRKKPGLVGAHRQVQSGLAPPGPQVVDGIVSLWRSQVDVKYVSHVVSDLYPRGLMMNS